MSPSPCNHRSATLKGNSQGLSLGLHLLCICLQQITQAYIFQSPNEKKQWDPPPAASDLPGCSQEIPSSRLGPYLSHLIYIYKLKIIKYMHMLYIIKGPMQVISGFLPETWGYLCMKNCVSTTRNCHSHIHESTHFIWFALLKLHSRCFPSQAFGPPQNQGHRGAPADQPSQCACSHVERIIFVNGKVVSNKISLTLPLFIDMSVPNQDSQRSCICILEIWTLSLSNIFYWMIGSWCLTPLSIIFQLYRGGYFYSIGFWNCCDSLVLF